MYFEYPVDKENTIFSLNNKHNPFIIAENDFIKEISQTETSKTKIVFYISKTKDELGEIPDLNLTIIDFK